MGRWNEVATSEWSRAAYYRAEAGDARASYAALNWSTSSKLAPHLTQPAWLITSYSAYSEQVGLVVASSLVSDLDDPVAKLLFATAVADEARHTDIFTRYARWLGDSVSPPSAQLDGLHDALMACDNPLVRLVAHTLLEGWAVDEFHWLRKVFAADLLSEIYRLVGNDEARHVNIGISTFRALWTNHAADAKNKATELDVTIWQGFQLATQVAGFDNDSLAALARLADLPKPALTQWFRRRQSYRLRRLGCSAYAGWRDPFVTASEAVADASAALPKHSPHNPLLAKAQA